MAKPKIPIEKRFWNRVEKTDKCWIWLGPKDAFGYGLIGSGGRGSPTIRTHRLSWTLSNGQIPKNLLVLHCCDRPGCVNPAHLFLGTQRDNMRDMNRKCR